MTGSVAASVAGQHPGRRAHRARHEHCLAHLAMGRGQVRMARWKGSRGALAVHAELEPPPADLVLLELSDVVGHVVDLEQVEAAHLASQHLLEGLAHAHR